MHPAAQSAGPALAHQRALGARLLPWSLERRRRCPVAAVAPGCRCFGTQSKEADASACALRQRWYRRQLAAHTLYPLDVMPLAQRTPEVSHVTDIPVSSQGCSTAARPTVIADVFLSCCASPACDEAGLRSIFAQLSADQQCAILTQAITHAGSYPRLPRAECIQLALDSSAFSPRHWLRLLRGLPDGTSLQAVPLLTIVERVLHSAGNLFTCNDDFCAFLACALGEVEARGLARSDVAATLERCELAFEAAAYASSSARFVAPPPPHRSPANGWGYGSVVHAMCALPEPPHRWFTALRREMPPALRQYSALVLLRSVALRFGVAEGSGRESRWRAFAEAHMTTLEAASALHFLLGMGNPVTARLLLPHCHTQQQIATLMSHTTQRLPVALALEALWRSVELRPSDRELVRLRLTHATTGQTVRLLFAAQAERSAAVVPESSAADGATVELFSRTLAVRFVDRATLSRCLRDVLPVGALGRGDRSLAHVLAAIPPSAVAPVVAAVTPLDGDALSWWAAIYTEAGNVEGAFAVLEATARRGCLPHMGVLVGLLEALHDDEGGFARAVQLLRTAFPQVAETVLRACVERAALRVTGAAAPSASTALEVQVLHALAALSTTARGSLAAADRAATGGLPSSAVSIQALAAFAETSTAAIALHVTALEGLVKAGKNLGFDVALAVEVVSAADGARCGAWEAAEESRPQLAQ